jgi:prepilin-type N-terminal cleavage/methylation domain-containing protein
MISATHSSYRKSQRGVTLIELMIAVSLVAIISAGMLIATRTSLLTYEKIEHRLQSNREAINTVDILNRELHSLIPAMGDCLSSAGPPSTVPLFSGKPESLIAVSQFSMAEGTRGHPQLLQFAVRPSPSGGVQLVVDETPYRGPSSGAIVCRDNAFLPPQAKASSVILVDRLASCRFTYHNLNNVMGGTQDTGWAHDWIISVTAPPILPAAIRVDMVPLESRSDTRPLPLYSVTVPILIERAFQEQYAD